MKSVKIEVTGIVQGVGFRFTVVRQAHLLNVVGSVTNRPDGSVYIEAKGDNVAIKQFIQFIKDGPTPFAKINDVQVTETSFKNHQRFTIN